MNREIKFRAWDCKQNKWVYYLAGEQLPEGCMDNSLNNWQYTGLKDKNGKEIYEGDILTHEKLHNTKNRMIFVMEWDNDRGTYSQYSPRQEFVVIGNIYETPELLK